MLVRIRALTVGALAAFALTACSADSGGPPQVAALSTSASASTTTSASEASDAAGRPRIRIDMTESEREALEQRYLQCLDKHGFAKAKGSGDLDAMHEAQAKCQSKDPLPPWQYDTSNPHAADFAHALVQCLRDKGVEYVSADPSGGRYVLAFGGPNNDPESISKGLKYMHVCEEQALAEVSGD